MDYGHDLHFGVFVTPSAEHVDEVVATAVQADLLGLDSVSVQDHPYQPAHLDAWTLLTHIAASTERVSVFPNVANLPLRPPGVLARSVASLDILSGGRAELGLGAGAFWDAIEAMGGDRRTPGEAVDALAEAISVIRALWTPGRTPRLDGPHYELRGAKPGPFPVHDVGIWLGAYKRRMLQLTGRVADGWLPSLGYVEPSDLAAMNAIIDDAASDAGRNPADVRRLLNVTGRFGGSGFLQGPPARWVEELADLALSEGVSGFVLMVDPTDRADLARFAEEVAPGVREQVEAERLGGPAEDVETPVELRADDIPQSPAPTGGDGDRLVLIHDHLRHELEQLHDLIEQVAAGSTSPAAARSMINTMAMRQNNWTLGTYCEAYCRLVTTHHTIEDTAMFPRLRAADPALGPTIDRLEAEHHQVAESLERVDQSLVALVSGEGLDAVRAAVAALDGLLRAHLSFEEHQLVPALNAHHIAV